jgi:hypothetical protein
MEDNSNKYIQMRSIVTPKCKAVNTKAIRKFEVNFPRSLNGRSSITLVDFHSPLHLHQLRYWYTPRLTVGAIIRMYANISNPPMLIPSAIPSHALYCFKSDAANEFVPEIKPVVIPREIGMMYPIGNPLTWFRFRSRHITTTSPRLKNNVKANSEQNVPVAGAACFTNACYRPSTTNGASWQTWCCSLQTFSIARPKTWQ